MMTTVSLWSVISSVSYIYIAVLVLVCPGPVPVHSDPQTYPLVFQNITTDRNGAGIIQILGLSINQSGLVVQGQNNSYSEFRTLNQPALTVTQSNNIYNYTAEYGRALSMPDPQLQNVTITNFGILASANDPIWVYGVKSDKGTTDSFMSLPVVDTSTSFFIAGWPRLASQTFLGLILVVAAVDDTCVEIYKIFNGTNYVLLQDGTASINKFQVFRYYSSYELNPDQSKNFNVGEDVTGYFVNSTKPVEVYFGHECAWVPSIEKLFCDYLVEQIPPVSQLSLRHVVPPISGRADSAGYMVRVVPTGPGSTTVTWSTGQASTSGVSMRGQWIQIDNPSCGSPLLVVCSQPCLVMQYNKGYLQVPNDVPTDPFMMLVVPDDRFTAGSCFGTANFCLDKGVTVEFDNWISVVTFDNYKDNIMLNGKSITNSVMGGLSVGWSSVTNGNIKYAVTSFRIPHDYHSINFAPGTVGSFAVYVYGHSRYTQSSSAYGMSANYNITGKSVQSNWKAVATDYQSMVSSDRNVTCQSSAQLTGATITGGDTQYIKFPFTLYAAITPAVTLSDVCLIKYNDTLFKLLQNFSNKINYWICMSKNCSYLQGKGVAIDYSSLAIQWIGSNKQYSAVQITVTMIGTYDTTAQNFAQCRADIKNYMYPFINWPPSYTSTLIAQTVGSGCPFPITFYQPKFVDVPEACPAIVDASR